MKYWEKKHPDQWKEGVVGNRIKKSARISSEHKVTQN